MTKNSDPAPKRLRPAPKGWRSGTGYRKLMEAGAAAYHAGIEDCPYQGPRNPGRWAWLLGWYNEANKPRPRLGVLADLYRVKAIFQLRTVEMLLRSGEARHAPGERSEPVPDPSTSEPKAKGSRSLLLPLAMILGACLLDSPSAPPAAPQAPRDTAASDTAKPCQPWPECFDPTPPIPKELI